MAELAESDCCSTAAQDLCCELTDKDACCGGASGGSCGCNAPIEAIPLPMVGADGAPIACSLDAGELVQRLDRIARIGSRSLLGADSDGWRHSLRFRDDRSTRTELEAVIAAERECCPFLGLSLDEGGGELLLAIDARAEGEPTAALLTQAFSSA